MNFFLVSGDQDSCYKNRFSHIFIWLPKTLFCTVDYIFVECSLNIKIRMNKLLEIYS
jgi:hypothetical protein